MIEIKFTSNKKKHLALFALETASRMQDVAKLIDTEPVLANATIYSLKESDIVEVYDRTDDDDDDGAYYKAVVKYVSIDDKVVKYSFVTWASDIEDARERTNDIITQNSLSLAEVVKLEKSTYTSIIDDVWLLTQKENEIILSDNPSLTPEDMSECVFAIEGEYGVRLLAEIGETRRCIFRAKHNDGRPLYRDTEQNVFRDLDGHAVNINDVKFYS